MNSTQILQAALITLAEVGPSVLEQHWNGDGKDGKINNAIQIIRTLHRQGRQYNRISQRRAQHRTHTLTSLQLLQS